MGTLTSHEMLKTVLCYFDKSKIIFSIIFRSCEKCFLLFSYCFTVVDFEAAHIITKVYVNFFTAKHIRKSFNQRNATIAHGINLGNQGALIF